MYHSAAWLESLGVKVEWTSVPWMDLVAKVRSQAPPHLWETGWTADYADPDNFLRIGCRSETGWRNQALDDLLDAARKVADHERRMALYQQADRILVEEAPIVPIAYMRLHLLVKPWVRFTPLPLFIWPWKDFTIKPH